MLYFTLGIVEYWNNGFINWIPAFAGNPGFRLSPE
jgi:hypothetical protein